MAENNQNKIPDTGHEWDGIRELTNPPPRWWNIAFVMSFVWMVAYIIIYPSIPLVNDYTKGAMGWSALQEYKDAVAKNDAIRAPYIAKLEKMSAEEILGDQEMKNFADSYTKALFGDRCASCHGSNGQGVDDMFPVLNDDDWLYGGTLQDITDTIAGGRLGFMSAFQGQLDEAELGQLADFVLNVSSGKATQAGWDAYNNAGCSGCHAEDATGNKWVGAPNLTDSIWRFGGGRDEVLHTIKFGVNQDGVEGTRSGVMPGFSEVLSANDIKLLTVRVWSLGGGQTE
ncbi:MAG: cytochrome-c oxidase, cbb3-type subunit III [Gammaproteobacteria bacterium]|nr:cytochrome-c oxidase, cbb3-type subunit III [Gammaproteobacteria bacterium]MCF6229453.1 cytochrome-c oxidase, cbb3-type subunit III [Gammaproteobacteria bacterium]